MVTKYNMRIIPKKGTPYNPVHDDFNNTTAVICDVTVGQRGWVVCNMEHDDWVRLHLSTVEKVIEHEHGEIEVVTRNTHYHFAPLS